jgi:hypothetical protein
MGRIERDDSRSTEAGIAGAMIFGGRLGIPRQLGSPISTAVAKELLVGSKLEESITSAVASSARKSVSKG